MQSLKIKSGPDGDLVFDPVRKKYVILTPEEEVRQKTILLLHQWLGYPLHLMSVERKLDYNGTSKRFDLMISDPNGQPYLLVECKAPEITLSQKTFDQVSVYNHIFKAPYLLITNGLKTIAAQVDLEIGSYDFINELPSYK